MPCALACGTIHPQFKSKDTAKKERVQINTSFSAARVSKAAVRASAQLWLSAQSLCHFSQELACPAFSPRQAHQGPLSNRQGKYSPSLLFSNSLLNYTAAVPPQVPLKHLLCAETLPTRHLSTPQACCPSMTYAIDFRHCVC